MGFGKNLQWDVRKLRPVRSRTSSPLPPGGLFPKTNAVTRWRSCCATARIPLTGDAEAREKYMAEGSYTEPLTVVKVQEHKNS
jgi:hypothetical protein